MQTQQLPRSLRCLTLALAIPAVSMMATAQTSVGTPLIGDSTSLGKQ